MQTAKIPAFVLAVALVTSGCGDSMSSLNPTAPSSVSPGSLNADAGAATVASGAMAKPGNGNGNNGNGKGNNGGGNGNSDARGNAPRTPGGQNPPGRTRMQLEGLISAVGNGSVTVNGYTVAVLADTVIRHGQTRFQLADLKAGDRVHVVALRTEAPGGAAATLEAIEINLQNPGEDGDEGEGEGEEPPPPTSAVTVAALDDAASEAGDDTGSFRLTRTGDPALLSAPLTVSFTLTGTATGGLDFQDVPLTATFAANQPTVDVTITPLPDSLVEGVESVVLTLTGAAPYGLGTPASATVAISDPPLPSVTVVAVDATASEQGELGIMQLTRTGSVASPLTVTVSIGGSATNGLDYMTVEPTVTFAPGSATVSVLVLAFPDGPDSPETVVLTVVDGAGYTAGSPATATVTITES